ncbi:MAG: glycosyltransferase family 2 protein [Candidatus Kerfeldbacteria bacterium]|nr:glycosyltransferase family 2 protein [Candidatus Kerfeldbacteria bacterium]
MSKQVSIVIPAYNEARYLEACLASLKAQDFSGVFEIIVVDNNSSDDTAAIASRLGARVIIEPTRGVCAARQAGTLAASGEVVLSTDADTTFPPNWLTRIWVEFSRDPEVVAVAGVVQYINAPWWARLYTRALFGTTNARYKLSGRVGYITACNTAFRKKAWSGYNTQFTQGGDEFGLLAQLKPKGKIVFQPDNTVFTSSRRLRRGLWYNMFVTIMLYYCVDYLLAKVTGKSVFGSYAPIRHDPKPLSPFIIWSRAAAVVAIVMITFPLLTHRVSAAHVFRATKTGLVTLTHRIQDPW